MNCMVAHKTSEPDSFSRSDSKFRWTNFVASIMSMFDIISMIFTIDSNSSERLPYKWMTCYSRSMLSQITAILVRISSDFKLCSSAFPLFSILDPCNFFLSFLQFCVSPNERIAQYFYHLGCTYCQKNWWMEICDGYGRKYRKRLYITDFPHLNCLVGSFGILIVSICPWVFSLLASSERYNTMHIFSFALKPMLFNRFWSQNLFFFTGWLCWWLSARRSIKSKHALLTCWL